MQVLLGFLLGFILASYLWNIKFKSYIDKTVFKRQPKVVKKPDDKETKELKV
jgi:hypothetical protein